MSVQAAENLVDFGERLERECSEICRSPLSCLAAERCWDPVHWVIKEHGWRFERLKSGRAVTVIAAANGS